VRASPSTFATDKAVRRDTVIGKRISGPLACSARRITDLRRLFRRDLAQIYDHDDDAPLPHPPQDQVQ
jgi:hypothetical protein